MTNDRTYSVGHILKASTEFLAARDVFEARKSCELLMSRLLNCRPLEIYVRFESALTETQVAAMRRGVKRLSGGEPAQYIVGRVDFMQHPIKVDKRALIPRPETECLVEAVLSCGTLWEKERPAVCEIGTGSGCIVISLALARRNGNYTATDASAEALQLAAANAVELGVTDLIRFCGSDLSDAVEPDSLDAVVANLPYVPTAEWQKLPSHIRNHEPRIALDGGPDGLAVIREIVPDAWFALKPGGTLFLEIGADQGGRVAAILTEAGFADVKIVKDLAALDRIAVAVRNSDC